jgi:hypothetical protein
MPLAGCRIFDGIDDHAETATNLDLSPYPAVTLLARVWWEEYDGLHWLTEYSLDTQHQPGGFFIGNFYSGPTTLAILMSSVGTPPSLAVHQRNITTPPTLHAWHALGVVFNRAAAGAQEIAVYLDGALVSTTWISASESGAPGTDDCTGPFVSSRLFFMSQQGTGVYGKGRLSDVAVYGAVLPADAFYLYALGHQADRFGSPLAYWPLEGLANPEPDLAGAHPLTVVGAVAGPPPPSLAHTLEVAAGHVTIGGNGALFAGEDKILALAAPTAPDGTPVPLAGASVLFEVRTTDTAATALLSKAATIAGTYATTRASNTERAIVSLTDTETATLTGGTVYRHSWKRLDAGAERMLAYGFFYPERATQI